MTVVLIVDDFPTVSQTFLVSKFLGLLTRGWDVQLLCLGEQKTMPDYFPDLLEPTAAARIHAANNDATQAEAILHDLRPTLIHFEFGALAVPHVGWKKALGCKFTASFRGYDLNYVGLDQPDFYRAVWHEVDGLHLLGQDLWQRAQRRGCPPTARHTLIPPAIDTTFFDPAERQHTDAVGTVERPLRLLNIGRLVWKKGHAYALDVVAALRAQGIQTELTIIGDGVLADDLLSLTYRLGLEDVVEYTGAQPRDFVRGQLGTADVLLHTAVSEGFCNAVLEAQAMCLPVVCSDADGLAENVADGITGFVLPRRQTAVFAEKLALLAQNPELRQRMGIAGRQRVRDHFRIENLIDQFETFYNQVLDL